jgi:hypothetical protein
MFGLPYLLWLNAIVSLNCRNRQRSLLGPHTAAVFGISTNFCSEWE